jgi:aminopeptidase N
MVKPVVPYMLFMEMVGKDRFLFAFEAFVGRWKGKHPTPFDFFYTMNDVLNENYNWFWNAWFMDFGYPDLGIEKHDNQVVIKRVGARALPLPVHLIILYKDGTTATVSKSMDIWKNGEREITIEIENVEEVKSIRLDEGKIPDIDSGNNYIEIN